MLHWPRAPSCPTGPKQVSIDEFHPDATWVAAREVHDLAPGAAVDINTDEIAYPRPFSNLAPGDYQVQAVLDVDHTYNYGGLAPGDLVSPVLALRGWTPGQGPEPQISLSTTAAPSERYKLTSEDLALFDTIAAQMYVAAYPHAAVKWQELALVSFP